MPPLRDVLSVTINERSKRTASSGGVLEKSSIVDIRSSGALARFTSFTTKRLL